MPMVDLSMPISKVDKEERIVYGIVLKASKEFDENGEPVDFKDTDGNWATTEEIKKACHRFNLKLQRPVKKAGVDKQHNEVPDYGAVVESYIAKSEIPEIKAAPGDWVAAVLVKDNETWEQVLAGEITGFSVGGKAVIHKKEGV